MSVLPPPQADEFLRAYNRFGQADEDVATLDGEATPEQRAAAVESWVSSRRELGEVADRIAADLDARAEAERTAPRRKRRG